MNNPLVSITVISYNSSAFIVETLESIKKQTYQNLELIISDDCSTDDTVSICKNWLEENKTRFSRVCLIESEKNRGIPGNCNTGWQKTKGEWIKLIAGDDLLLPTCIETNLAYVHSHKDAKVIFSEAIKIDENSQPLPTETNFYNNELPNWRHYFFNQSNQRQLKLYARDPIFLINPSLFVDRSLLEKIGGFDEHLRIFEDVVLILKLLRAGYPIHYVPKETVAYRIHSGSVSKSKNKEKELQNLSELNYIYKNYRKPLLKNTNLFDLNTKLIAWFEFDYIQKYHLKGSRFLQKLNTFRVYQRLICIKK